MLTFYLIIMSFNLIIMTFFFKWQNGLSWDVAGASTSLSPSFSLAYYLFFFASNLSYYRDPYNAQIIAYKSKSLLHHSVQ